MCVCVLDLWMLCLFVERCFESLTYWVDLCLSSLLVAFICICFSSLEKLLFFKLDSFLTDTSTHPFLLSLFALLSIDTRQYADPSRFSSDLFVSSTDPQHILDPSRSLGFFLIAPQQLLDPLRWFPRASISLTPSRQMFRSIEFMFFPSTALRQLDRFSSVQI